MSLTPYNKRKFGQIYSERRHDREQSVFTRNGADMVLLSENIPSSLKEIQIRPLRMRQGKYKQGDRNNTGWKPN